MFNLQSTIFTALLLILLTTNTYCYFNNKSITKEYNDFRVAVETESVKVAAENEALRVAQKQQIDTLEKDHKHAINTLNSTYKSRISRLQLQASSNTSTSTTNSSCSRSSDESPTDVGFDPRILASSYVQLEEQCAVTTLNFIFLQQYANDLQLQPKP